MQMPIKTNTFKKYTKRVTRLARKIPSTSLRSDSKVIMNAVVESQIQMCCTDGPRLRVRKICHRQDVFHVCYGTVRCSPLDGHISSSLVAGYHGIVEDRRVQICSYDTKMDFA